MTEIDYILESALRQADSAEVLYEESESRDAAFENNRLKCLTTRQGRGAGLRLIKNGRIGFSSTTDMSKLDKLVRDAVASAEFGQEARFAFPPQPHAPGSAVKVWDSKVADYPMEDGVEAAKGAIDTILASAPDVQCEAEIEKAVAQARLVNSQGLDLEIPSTDFGMGLFALRVQGESFLGIGEGEESRERKGDFQKHAKTIIEKLALSRKEVKPATGTYPVVFAPKAVGTLLGTFLSGTNGKLVQKGASPLTGKIGEKLLDARVAIHDDPLVDFGPGSTWVDSEGVCCRRLPLFEAGVLRNFIFDLQTAGMLKAASTGHGMRGFSSQPSPGHTNVIVSPGKMALRDMLREMKRGLLVDQVLGGGQSNVLAGEFSVNLELAFLVERGEVVGRVKDCMIAGNVFEAFNRIVDLGCEMEWHGAMHLPAVLFEAMSVAGAD